MTELREMQKKLTEQTKALQNALEAAEEANRAKSDFLTDESRYQDTDERHHGNDGYRIFSP